MTTRNKNHWRQLLGGTRHVQSTKRKGPSFGNLGEDVQLKIYKLMLGNPNLNATLKRNIKKQLYKIYSDNMKTITKVIGGQNCKNYNNIFNANIRKEFSKKYVELAKLRSNIVKNLPNLQNKIKITYLPFPKCVNGKIQFLTPAAATRKLTARQ